MDDTSIPESPVNEKGGGEDIVLRGALFFARRGFEVFPVDPKNKMPRKSERVSGTKWGKTTDPDEIRRDWGKWPDSNVGLATGPVSGFFVIDIDVKDNGFETWEKLTAERPPLPQTVTVETPTGGRHYWWRYPVAVDVKNSARTVVGPGVDVRGDGGFVVAPPSVKVDTFGTVVGPYRFMPGCSPVIVEVAEAPEWLLAAVRKKPKAARTTPAPPPEEEDDALTVEAAVSAGRVGARA